MDIVILWGKNIKFRKKLSFSLFTFVVVVSFSEGIYKGLFGCIYEHEDILEGLLLCYLQKSAVQAPVAAVTGFPGQVLCS